jgi:RNA polymerase sigma-70 factor (ECF subfamily)
MKTKQEQFEQLFKESRSKLYNVAYNMTKNRENAEEVLQEAYVKAWKNFGSYDPEKKFTNWMTTIIRNAGIDANRLRNKNVSTFSINSIFVNNDKDSSQNLQLDVEDKSSDLYAMLENKELMKNIYESVAKLPADLQIVMIPFMEGQTYTEISDSSNLALTTVRARVHRGKKILRNSIIIANF